MPHRSSSSQAEARSAAALARNERYVREFVEAFSFCPYAKRCRETGKLHRVVLLHEGGQPGTPGFETAAAAIASAIERVERLPAESVEVALLILPALVPALASGIAGARGFEMLVSAARRHMEARHGGGDTPFYLAAFHPDFAEDLSSEHRAVRFLRRSPDPTLQLVRAAALRKVRGVDPGAPHFVPADGPSAAELLAMAAAPPVSDRIALANLDTLRREDADRLRRLLFDIRGRSEAGD